MPGSFHGAPSLLQQGRRHMQGYVWLDAPGSATSHSNTVVLLPELARPYTDVAELLDMLPVMTYASYVLANWQRYALGPQSCLEHTLPA